MTACQLSRLCRQACNMVKPAPDQMECLQCDGRGVSSAVYQSQTKIGVHAGGSPPSLQQLQLYAESISSVIAPQGYDSAHCDRLVFSLHVQQQCTRAGLNMPLRMP